MLSKNQIKLIKSLETKKNRKREGLFVAEGPKVVGDLLRAGYQPHSIYATPQGSLFLATPHSQGENAQRSTSNVQCLTARNLQGAGRRAATRRFLWQNRRGETAI